MEDDDGLSQYLCCPICREEFELDSNGLKYPVVCSVCRDHICIDCVEKTPGRCPKCFQDGFSYQCLGPTVTFPLWLKEKKDELASSSSSPPDDISFYMEEQLDMCNGSNPQSGTPGRIEQQQQYPDSPADPGEQIRTVSNEDGNNPLSTLGLPGDGGNCQVLEEVRGAEIEVRITVPSEELNHRNAQLLIEEDSDCRQQIASNDGNNPPTNGLSEDGGDCQVPEDIPETGSQNTVFSSASYWEESSCQDRNAQQLAEDTRRQRALKSRTAMFIDTHKRAEVLVDQTANEEKEMINRKIDEEKRQMADAVTKQQDKDRLEMQRIEQEIARLTALRKEMTDKQTQVLQSIEEARSAMEVAEKQMEDRRNEELQRVCEKASLEKLRIMNQRDESIRLAREEAEVERQAAEKAEAQRVAEEVRKREAAHQRRLVEEEAKRRATKQAEAQRVAEENRKRQATAKRPVGAEISDQDINGSVIDVEADTVQEVYRSCAVGDRNASAEQAPCGEGGRMTQDGSPDSVPSTVHEAAPTSIEAPINVDCAGGEGDVDVAQRPPGDNHRHDTTRVPSVARVLPKRGRSLHHFHQQNKRLRRVRTTSLARHPKASRPEDAIMIDDSDSDDDDQHGPSQGNDNRRGSSQDNAILIDSDDDEVVEVVLCIKPTSRL